MSLLRIRMTHGHSSSSDDPPKPHVLRFLGNGRAPMSHEKEDASFSSIANPGPGLLAHLRFGSMGCLGWVPGRSNTTGHLRIWAVRSPRDS